MKEGKGSCRLLGDGVMGRAVEGDEVFLSEWRPAAGPDGEQGRAWRASVCSSKRGCDETAWLMKQRFSLAPQRAQPFLIPIHH